MRGNTAKMRLSGKKLAESSEVIAAEVCDNMMDVGDYGQGKPCPYEHKNS
jgi:hypothetical protein